jgi:tetratricopeptide (TPR) repeat protein
MGIIRFLGVLRAWAYGHWLRGVIVAGTILGLIAITMAGWAYLASVALHSGELSIDSALAAYDKGRYEEARKAVSHMLNSGHLPRSEFGGPLFILGAIKTKDAEGQASADRRRIEYLIASRYLSEARAHGLPTGREAVGIFLLGKSLLESGQFGEGVRVLDELATSKPQDQSLANETQRTLAEACLTLPHPNVEKALACNSALLEDAGLSNDDRAAALIQRAECLTRLHRYDEARQTVAQIPPGTLASQSELMNGRIALDELESTLGKLPSERASKANQSASKLADGLQHLKEAATLDQQKGQVTRESSYQSARATGLMGDVDKALKQFARTRQLYVDSYEGLAAALAEADLLREKGEFDNALSAYRRVLEMFASVPVYRSPVLSANDIRQRMMVALKDFLGQRRFSDSLTLLDAFPPLFSRAEQLELRGAALEQWGNQLLSDSSDENSPNPRDRAAGLRDLRAAGKSFELLAELQFATKSYTADLWRAAEDYFQGQSFSNAISLLNEYLHYEPELRNAQALLRLGQSYLALGHVQKSITAFDECIEFHPLDNATFQARIDCAKANWHRGNTKRAEELLRENIAGSALKPVSPEWKDSLFELGMLLHDTERYDQAIGVLEQAVERYPEDPQRLVAQYVIGESYRRWSQDLIDRAQSARTISERDKNMQVASERLTTALRNFEDVHRAITLKTHDIHSDPAMGAMLRNCYMLEGAVLFDLGSMTGEAQRYKEAIETYSNVSSLYPDEPFVLEIYLQISNCWRRLQRHDNARGAIKQAQIALEHLAPNADFASTTVLDREEWRLLLADMCKW